MSGAPEAAEQSGIVRDAIDFGRLAWIRPFATAYAHDFDSVAPFFAGNPADPEAWRRTIARVTEAPRERTAIVDILTQQLDRRGAPQAARDAAARLADPAAVAVVSGQQAGVFGGPLYTLLKAVTAIQLSREVTRRFGVPAVAVFWVADEDHDWDEIRTVEVLDREFELLRLTVASPPGAGDQAVGRLAFDDRLNEVHESLEAGLAPTEHTSDVLAALRKAYGPGTKVGSAFAHWIDTLLGSQGLVVFEGGDPAAKPLVADLFARELTERKAASLAREAGAALTARGHTPQVVQTEDAVALFYFGDAGRLAIRERDGRLVAGDRSWAPRELCTEAIAHPERFSPNVLLRPVVQDRLFPTVCYVPGPSELAYEAQLGGIYQAFGVESPLFYPRVSVTIVDAVAARFLDRHLPLEALKSQDEAPLNRLLETYLPPGIDSSLAETQQIVAETAGKLRDAVRTVDPTLVGAVDTTLDRVRDTLKHLQSKIVQASKRKEETLRRQFVHARNLTFPGGHPQERALNLIFFVNRYGLDLGKTLVDHLPLASDKHYVVAL